MHHLWLYLAFGAVYMIGYVRGAYVYARCQSGNCPYFWCKNHKR